VPTPPEVDPARAGDPLAAVVPLAPAGVPLPATPEVELDPELAPLEPPPPTPLFATVSGCVLALPQPVARRVTPKSTPLPRKTTTALFM
jgi:hypothetical protein